MRKRIKPICWALVAVALSPMQGAAQRGRPQVEEGNRLYSEGLFNEAHQKYLEALIEDPESPLIRFNDGNALYEENDFQKAVERYKEAVKSGDPALQSAAWYNLGNALYRQQQLQESLEAYKEALRQNPSDVDAKHNLERVLQQLQKQEEQPQQQQQQGGDQDQQGDQKENQSQQEQQSGEAPKAQEDEAPTPEQSQGEEAQPQEESQVEGEQTQPQPGEMTPQEAERLLNAIREDPGEVNRKRAPATGKRPRKDW